MIKVLMWIAKWIHRVFPFSQLRMANFLLKLNKRENLLVACTLFDYKIELNVHRSTMHVLLYMQGEKFLADDIAFLGPHVKKGMIAFDVGANIGYLTYFLCRQVGPGGQVFSFEPDPDNYSELSKNIHSNNISFCQPVQTAVGSFDGSICFNYGFNGHVEKSAGLEENCKITSLDSFIIKSAIPRVDLVKIDVEGYELNVLEGMSQILAREKKPILYVEVHPFGFCDMGDPRKVLSFLERYYTRINAYIPLDFRRKNFSPREKLLNVVKFNKQLHKECQVSLKAVKENQHLRFQLVCLP